MYIAAGKVVERVWGKSWAAFVDERILAPLGMEMTRRAPWQVSLGSQDLLVETYVRETCSCLGEGPGSWYDI